MAGNTFPKSHRLCGNHLTERLFAEGDRSIGCFPVRLVWLLLPESDPDFVPGLDVRILVSASKKHFKHAVDRNRVKRQVREFFRINSHDLSDSVAGIGSNLLVAVLFTDSRLWASSELQPRLDSAFRKLQSHVSDMAVK